MSADAMDIDHGPSSVGGVENMISNQTKILRRHLGLGESPGMPPQNNRPVTQPLFFIESAPSAPRGANCKLSTCRAIIEPDDYRVAVQPGIYSKADLFHVACLEEIADLSDVNFLDRISPLTRSTFALRGLKANNILDGDYLVDGAVERLVLEWKVTRGRWIDERDGVVVEELSPTFNNILRRAGSSNYIPQSVPGMSQHEYFLLSHTLAPFESDGPEDNQEWNLFDSYLSTNEGSLHERHNLSNMLQRWQHDKRLAGSEDHELNEAERQAKAQLGAKAIRAIKRLSAVPMPDIQGAFFGR